MKATPKHNISSERATDLINSGNPLIDYYVSGSINFEGIDGFEKSIIVENCIVENLTCISTLFTNVVEFKNSDFINCQFTFCYFSEGLDIENCFFENGLDFQAGGHNKKPFKIKDSIFKQFVNFFDCWYQSEIIILNNDFQKGTNLLGKPNGIPVSFDIKPVILNNKGEINLDNEG